MSSQFLDELLDEELFRNTLEPWLSGYQTTLGFTEEDERTKILVQFIKQTIKLKRQLESAKEQFLQTVPQLEFTSARDDKEFVFKSSPDASGCYLEVKCKNANCCERQLKMYAYAGTNITFNYLTYTSLLRCPTCHGSLCLLGIGFQSCRWACRGSTMTGLDLDIPAKVSWYGLARTYTKSCVVSLGKWGEMLICVSSLTPSELTLLHHFLTTTTRSPPPEPMKHPKPSPPCLCIEQASPAPRSVLISIDPGSEIGKLLFEVAEKNREIIVLRERLKAMGNAVSTLREEEGRLSKALAELKATNRIE